MSGYLPNAIAYIQQNGDELERGRLAGLLGRERPDQKVVRALGTRQNEDGAFPYQMVPGRPSAVTATATALQWMADLRQLRSPQAERAAAFLLTVQRPDGAWEESPALVKFDPPPLTRPGHTAGRLYCTALSAFWLGRLVGPSHESVQRAFGYLRASRDGGWPEDEPMQVTVLATAVCAMAGAAGSRLAVAGLEVLARMAPEAWSADRLADLLGALYGAGYSTEAPQVSWALRRLVELHREDGGWASEYGPDRDVDLSLRVLAALLAFGVPSGV